MTSGLIPGAPVRLSYPVCWCGPGACRTA